MSTRGLPGTFVLSDYLRDLDAVVERLGVDHFVLDGVKHYGHVAVQYAVAHPKLVEALILKHCSLLAYPADRGGQETARENWDFFLTLVSGFLPGDRDATVDFLRQAVTQHDWLTIAEGVGVSDIASFLPDLDVPTLLLHARGWRNIKQEEAAKLAAGIAGSRLVLTEGSSEIIDAAQGLKAIDDFLQDLPSRPAAARAPDTDLLSAREIEVLRLLSQGKSNPEIAKELFITRNTVQNHVSSILIKTNLTNRAQAAVYARDHGIS
jgi:DNA-binding CsgD family transcriptional regulator